ncbi:MAG: cell envelope integrity protein CreD [Sedimentisphaerales bacterium]|nr:cell envelope integrity protein CreD [Sedimentisphaerales bacterium]
MSEEQDTSGKTRPLMRYAAIIKVMSIGLLVLVLLIPASMISRLMRERQARRDSVIQEINQKWDGSQTITGPFLTIPYKSLYQKNKEFNKFQYIHILPETINITGQIDPQIRYRSLYEAVLYNTQLKIEGVFKIPTQNLPDIDTKNILWDKALFSLGITDMRGIQDTITVLFNEATYKANPGLVTPDIANSGVQCPITLSPTQKDHTFSLQLNLNGSEQLQFIPVGETTSVTLRSTWPSPSFNGAFLPVTRDISDKGFSAAWNVLHLNRNFPQAWDGNQHKVSDSSFGLKLLITADIYQKSIRLSKYALMFIVFTFSAFFLTEIINKKKVHPIQYLLIGLAVVLFYILLVSISEHLNFNIAYIISALAITTLITGYSKAILRSNLFAFTVCAILIILYAYLFIVIQLEDFALIMGSIGLFLVLTIIMYLTRKIDWYTLNKNETM